MPQPHFRDEKQQLKHKQCFCSAAELGLVSQDEETWNMFQGEVNRALTTELPFILKSWCLDSCPIVSEKEVKSFKDVTILRFKHLSTCNIGYHIMSPQNFYFINWNRASHRMLVNPGFVTGHLLLQVFITPPSKDVSCSHWLLILLPSDVYNMELSTLILSPASITSAMRNTSWICKSSWCHLQST